MARTRHFNPDGTPKYANRLLAEDSPYLRQHGHNPVDWYPWGAEAFALARQLDRPVFLSIGYSTCHWCHVMEEESFDNEAIAALLNERFVCIKVDREQRPDVDEIYMTGVQLVSGHGGWPMSSFLTPDGRPFYAGTYYPPAQFTELLGRVDSVWKERRADIEEQASRIATTIAQMGERPARESADVETASRRAEQSALDTYDARSGGYGRAPKFPHEPLLGFLLTRALRERDSVLLPSLRHTLRRMAQGGICDQVGGGFHRYSVDAEWLVPHFEKMLYNQAALIRIYVDGFRLTADPLFRRVVEQTIDYVLRDMRSPDGLFYSATDADSEGEEGLFFLWTEREIDEALPARLAATVKSVFGVTPRGNFEGRNILNLPLAPDDYAREHDLDETKLLADMDEARSLLYQVREQREHPLRDEKVIVAWNGMMIRALCEAAVVFGREDWLRTARQCAESLWLVHGGAQPASLWRISLGAEVSVPAMQEDYAYLAEALLALYDATADRPWLERARSLVEAMDRMFLDADGSYFQSRAEQEVALITRVRTLHDGATASGNAVALAAKQVLYRRTGEESFRRDCSALLKRLSGELENHPQACSYSLRGAEQLLHGEDGPVQWAAGGRIRVVAELVSESGKQAMLHVEVHLPADLRIYASDRSEQQLAASVVVLDDEDPHWRSIDTTWDESCAADGNLVLIGVALQRLVDSPAPLRCRLDIQACAENFCLAPESLRFVLPIVG